MITTAGRVQVDSGEGEKPREYLIWTEIEIRINDFGNKGITVRTNMGLYPLLEAVYRWQWTDDGVKEKVHDRPPEEYPGYYQPWNESTKKEISKYVLKDKDHRRKLNATQFFLQKEGDQQKMVVSYQDFMEKSFDELYRPREYGPIEKSAPATS